MKVSNNMNASVIKENSGMQIGKYLWALFIVLLYILPGQIGLGRWMRYLMPVRYILMACVLVLFGYMQYFFFKSRSYKLSFTNPSHLIIICYLLFALYIILSMLFASGLEINLSKYIHIPSKKFEWLLRYIFLLFILQSALLLSNSFQLIKPHLYQCFFISGIVFLLYFFINFSIRKDFYVARDCLIIGNGVGILSSKYLLISAGLLLFGNYKIKKTARYFFWIFIIQSALIIASANYRQSLLACISVVGIYILIKDGLDVKKLLINVIVLLSVVYGLSRIAPGAFKKIQRTSSFASRQYTQSDVESIMKWNFLKATMSKFPLHYKTNRQFMQLLCFITWQYNVVFGFGYGCFKTAPHNIFFEILGSLGLVGMALFLSPCLIYIFYCGKIGLDRFKIFMGMVYLFTFFQNYYTGTYVFSPHLYWVLALGLLDKQSLKA